MHANLRILYVLIALTLVTAGVWWFQGGQGNLGQIEGTDFAVADTSSIDKIFIADMDGGQVTLTRPSQGSLWDVNGQFKAREDAVNLLLKTFLRAGVQGPVAEAAQPNVIGCFPPAERRLKSIREGRRRPKLGTWAPPLQATRVRTWCLKPRTVEVPLLTSCTWRASRDTSARGFSPLNGSGDTPESSISRAVRLPASRYVCLRRMVNPTRSLRTIRAH